MAHIKKYKSHYLLAGILSMFWVGILFAMPMVRQARGVSFWQCGNGVLEGTEVCDDGNITDAGTCNATCTASTFCGDNTVQNPDGMGVAEQCDNGSLNGTPNHCNTACSALTPSICGNTIVEAGESCDDGNILDGDGCSAHCAIEIPAPVCGNGKLEDTETCDDGNILNGDGCSSTCQIEPPLPVCGNGTVEAGEACDDGTTTGLGTCNATCSSLTICGDAVVQNPDGIGIAEQCDDGNQSNTDGCLNSCKLAVCGDGFMQIGAEQCDDGNTVNGDGCSATCAIEPPPASCGNGKVESGEVCDEGPLNGTPNHCNGVCLGTTSSVCGNNIVEVGEACDDGNTTDQGTCNSTCSSLTICGDAVVQNPDGIGIAEQCDDGNQSNSDACLSSCKLAKCGDGFVQLGTEACDDGNTMNGDGCSATCTIEIPACVEPSIKITFNHVEVVNAPSWKSQVASGDKTFNLTGNFLVIPLSQVQTFQSNLLNAFQIGWEGVAQEKHLRIGSMKESQLNSKIKLNYGIELDYTVEFLGDVNVTKFNRMTLEVGKDKIVFSDGKIVYNGDRADGTHFLTGNGPSDDWSKYYLDFKSCEIPKPICDKDHGWDRDHYRYFPGYHGECVRQDDKK